MTTPFKGQKYNDLKKNLLKTGEFFIDPEFPTSNKSLFFSKVDNEIVWKRPHELCKIPRLVVEGVTSDDLNQGEIGNAYFVSACASLTLEPKLFNKVLPKYKEQEWVPEQHHPGIFHFNFWRQGEWLDVVIDDQLPTKDGKLVFCHAKNRNEFWSALLEKAYAKLYGDYESLTNGDVADVLVDLTGGVSQTLLLKEMEFLEEEGQAKLLSLLLQANENQSLIVCNMDCAKDEIGDEEEIGLVRGHGYCVTAVKKIEVQKGLQTTVGGGELNMVRLQNPWGVVEWKGAWSDESPEWQGLTPNERNQLGLKFTKEAEFWMTYEDFLKYFTKLDIIYFVNTSMFSLKKTWCETLLKGSWISGPRGTEKDRAGGCSQHATFLANPQFMFDVSSASGDTLMISLEQDDMRMERKTGGNHLNIGFEILKVEENRVYRVHNVVDLVCSSEFRERRSVYEKYDLPKGRFVIIPCTFAPGFESDFLLRIYTGDKMNAKELTLEGPKKPGALSCCVKHPQLVVVVTVIKAVGLEKKVKGTTDPFAVIKCENETVKTHVVKDNVDPEWGTRAIFYKKVPDSPLIIELYNNNMMINDFMGMATITQTFNEEGDIVECELLAKKKKEKDVNVKLEGTLHVKIQTSLDLTDL